MKPTVALEVPFSARSSTAAVRDIIFWALLVVGCRGAFSTQIFQVYMRSSSSQLDDALSSVEDMIATRVLSPAAYTRFHQGKLAVSDLQPFAEAIRQISSSYTEGRAALRSFRPNEAAAYALYYLPINFAKLWFLFSLLPKSFVPKSLLDFGCGPGTAALAATQFFGPLAVTALESSTAMKALAADFVGNTVPIDELHFVEDLERVAPKFSLVVAANVLNELGETEALNVAYQLAARVAPGGCLIILEPGMQLPTQRLMQVRDALLASERDLTPLFPCTRRDACPMRKVDSTDWCHGTLTGADGYLRGSRLVPQLDEVTGFNKHRVKYAAMVFQRDGKTPTGLRVIRESQRSASGFEFSLCGPDFYGSVTLPKRSLSDSNRAARKLPQYARVSIEPRLGSRVLSSDNVVEIREDTLESCAGLV